jgi:hypothetical protein
MKLISAERYLKSVSALGLINEKTDLNRKWLCLVLPVVLLCFTEYAGAQEGNLIEISGQVLEQVKSSPLPDVSVQVKGTITGTLTNSEGKFRLRTRAKLPFTLVFNSDT